MIVVVAGVSGSGKSTIGALMADLLCWQFEDGDALHPAANVAKMRAGVPLTDADRWPWLAIVAAWMDKRIAAGQSAVVACSALKRSYRDLLCQGRPDVRVVMLQVDEDTLARRLTARHGHFFPARLLASQLADLELPGPGEQAVTVPASGEPSEAAASVMERLGLTAATKRAMP